MGGSTASLPTSQQAHSEFPHPVFSRLCAPAIETKETFLRAKFPAVHTAWAIFSFFSPSSRQAMSRTRKTPTRRHPWTPLETSTLCPPGKRWRQRSRQLSTKVLPIPSCPRRKAKGQREPREGLFHSQGERVCTYPGPFLSATGGLGLPGEAGSPSPCPTVLRKAHWPFCLPTVGIVPPRTKSPADEELTPLRVVRRSADGLTNGLSSRVSTACGPGRAGVALVVQGPLCVPRICPPFKKSRPGGGRQDKWEDGNSPTGEVSIRETCQGTRDKEDTHKKE